MNAFIDLGSHFGSILRKFVASKSHSPGFNLFAFEANPKIGDITVGLYPRGTIRKYEAAWIADCQIPFYLSETHSASAQGCSVLKDKITGDLDTARPVMVDAIDFSKWLRERFTESDNVIVKCNIEGAEYPVFTKIMDDGNMGIIKKLFLKRHWNKIGMSQEDDLKFLDRLKAYSHLELTDKYEF